VSDVRCRACGAAVPAGADWCSLCFADLREPAPVREPVSVAAESVAEAALPAPLPAAPPRPAANLLDVAPRHAAEPDDSDETAAGAVGADAAGPAANQATWPCQRCGEQVPMALDTCSACGAGFLSAASTTIEMRLPVVGDVGRLSRTQRLLAGLGISLLVMLVLVLLATLGGHLL
jgi:ribosomal protein L37E